MKKIKKLLSFIFLLFVTLTFAESEIPHQIIDDNPAKEVTTIESKKLKEKAELDILVNKITPIVLKGVERKDGKTIYNIIKTEEEKNILNRVKRGVTSTFSNEMSTSNDVEYFITEDLSKILNGNQKQYKGRSRRSVPQGIEYETVKNDDTATTLIVNTNRPVYIAKMRNGNLENVFSGIAVRDNENLGNENTTNIFKLGTRYYIHEKGKKSEFKREDLIGLENWLDNLWINNQKQNSARLENVDSSEKIEITVGTFVDVKMTWYDRWAKYLSIDNIEAYPGKPITGYRWWFAENFTKTWLTDEHITTLYNITKLQNINTRYDGGGYGYDSLPGGFDLDAHIVVENDSKAIPGVYEYIHDVYATYYGNYNNDTIAIRYFDYIVIPREVLSKTFNVEPKFENDVSIINIQNTIFDESKSKVTGAATTLPTEWRLRSDDSGTIDSEDGLALEVTGNNITNQKRINKRDVELTTNTGLNIKVWLDVVNGVGKLKYKILKFGTSDTTVSVIVRDTVINGSTDGTGGGLIPLYKDTVNIKIPGGITNKGSVEATLDKRLLKKLKEDNDYINISKNSLNGKTNYDKLMKVNNQTKLTQINQSANITNYIAGSTTSGFKYYNNNKQNGDVIGIKTSGISDIVKSDLYFRKSVGSTWTNAEMLTSVKELFSLKVNEDGKAPEAGYVGEGSIVMSFAELNDSIEFPMGKNAKDEMDKRNAPGQMITSKFVLKDFSGVFPTTNGIEEEDKNIVDNLRIVYGNGTIQSVLGTVYTDDKVKIEIDQNTGNLKITKLTTNNASQVMTIEYRYRDVVLGTFKLNIVNKTPKKLESTDYIIDNRVKGLTGKWFFYNRNKSNNTKNVYNGRTLAGKDTSKDYKELIQVTEGNYSGNSNIYRIAYVEGRNFFKETNSGYQLFLSNEGDWTGESAAPYGISLSEFLDKVTVSIYNSDSTKDSNLFYFITDDLQPYTLEVKETLKGEEAQNAVAKLDLSSVKLNDEGVWKGLSTGDTASTNNTGLILSITSQKLFEAYDIEKKKAIVTTLIIKDSQGKELAKVSGNIGQEVVATTEYNKFVIKSNGDLAISKIKHNYEENTYTIEPYYNDLKLGSLTVTILNDTPVDIGKVGFGLDNRLKGSIGWVYIDGKGSLKITEGDIGAKEDYNELIKVGKQFANLEEKAIKRVISVDGKNSTRSYKRFAVDQQRNEYTYFTKDSTNYNDSSSAIPYKNNITLNSLNTLLATAVNRTGDDPENIFIVETDDGMRYKGNVIETYFGEEAVKSVGTIDFTKSSHIATWEPNSSGLAINGKTKIEFTQGEKLFNTLGKISRTGTSIADKLEVTQEDGSSFTSTKDSEGNLIVKIPTGELFELDKAGRLTIRGSYEKTTKTFTIKAYLKKVLLGEFKATLKTGDAFVIEGEDTYDFGAMLGGEIYNLTGKIHIRNLGNLEVTKVSVPTTASMTHKTDSTQTIPLKLQSSTTIVGEQDVDAVISVDALPIKNQAIGDYEGEFIVTITINETAN